jgi:hypothetical protein
MPQGRTKPGVEGRIVGAAGPARIRIVSRPGLGAYAGPSARDLFVARWLPALVPLLLYGVHRLAGRYEAFFYFLTAVALLQGARTWLRVGAGLGILVPVQLLGAVVATALLGFNTLSPEVWLFYSGATALMMGYVSYFFNLVGSYLPR